LRSGRTGPTRRKRDDTDDDDKEVSASLCNFKDYFKDEERTIHTDETLKFEKIFTTLPQKARRLIGHQKEDFILSCIFGLLKCKTRYGSNLHENP